MIFDNSKLFILIFSIFSLYYLHSINFIKDGEIGSFGFELLQLIYSIKVAIYAFNLSDNYIKSFLLHPFIVILLVHIFRFIINFKKIFNISKKSKHFILDIISLIYIYYICNNNSYNYILYGFIYYFIAVNSFSNNYNNYNNTTKLYSDIPLTFILIFINIFHFFNIIKIDNHLLPVLIGDCLYHIYELYTYFTK